MTDVDDVQVMLLTDSSDDESEDFGWAAAMSMTGSLMRPLAELLESRVENGMLEIVSSTAREIAWVVGSG